MDADILVDSVAHALPFLALAGVFYLVALWKKSSGRSLHARAQQHLLAGNRKGALDDLRQALWRANEEPVLERRILTDLDALYRDAGLPFSAANYELLIEQFDRLSKKHSQKAHAEMKKVLALKKQLIDHMPALA